MKYTRNLISFFILTVLVGLGSLVLSTGQVGAFVGPCDIIIQKEADPADNTPFDFLITGDHPGEFTLKDPSASSTIIPIGFEDIVTVTEEVPSGWILDENIECTKAELITVTNVPNGRTFKCLNESTSVKTVTCTFFNVNIERNVPTLSQWGLIAMAGILGIVGFMVMRRRKVTA